MPPLLDFDCQCVYPPESPASVPVDDEVPRKLLLVVHGLEDSPTSFDNSRGSSSAVILPPKRGQKRVRFATLDEVHDHLHRNDMTRREMNNLWMSPIHFETIKQVINFTVVLMTHSKSGHLLLGDDFCSRGLEQFLISEERKGQTQRSREAVLAAQDLFAEANETDDDDDDDDDDGHTDRPQENISLDEKIATIYNYFSKQAGLLALEQGLQDYKDCMEEVEMSPRFLTTRKQWRF